MSLEKDFYGHGIEMSSEIPTSQKTKAFNIAWKADYAGKGYSAKDKKEARKAYNKGWKDYKTGDWEPQFSFPWFWLIAGGALIYLLYKKKQQTQPQIPSSSVTL